MKKEILLIQTPPWGVDCPPVGVASLASFLDNNGVSVKVYDLNIELWNQVLNFDLSFKCESKVVNQRLDPNLWITDAFEFWSEGFCLKDDQFNIVQIAKDILAFNINVIGFSATFASIPFLNAILREIKNLLGQQQSFSHTIIIGGAVCCHKMHRDLIDADLVDCFIQGEGEFALLEALKGSFFSCLDSPININNLPFLDFKWFDLDLYKEKDLLPISISRGCINQCNFCSDWQSKKIFRFKKAENVFAEMCALVKKYKRNRFEFCDLLINGNLQELEKLCDLINESFLPIVWGGQVAVRNDMSLSLIQKMKQAGCGGLTFGCESFSDDLLDKMNKPFRAKDAEVLFAKVKSAGIIVEINLMVGFPGETDVDIDKTIEFLKRNKGCIDKVNSLNICYIGPGMPIWNRLKEFGIDAERINDWSSWETKDGLNTLAIRKARHAKVMRFLKDNKMKVSWNNVGGLGSDFFSNDLCEVRGIRSEPDDCKLPQLYSPLSSCIILLTLSCNLKCKMCNLWTNKEAREDYPDVNRWKRFIDSIPITDETFNVIFGGGEPLLFKEELVELIAYAHKKGFRTSLATSGYLLDKETAKLLSDAGIDYVAFTLYSLNEKKQLFLRGVNGTVSKVKQAINWFKKYKPEVEIAIDTVLMQPSLKDTIPLLRWVQNDKRISRIMFQAVMQPFHTKPLDSWYKHEKYKYLWPSDLAEINAVIDQIVMRKQIENKRGFDKITNSFEQLEVFRNYFKNPSVFIKRKICNVGDNGSFGVAPDGAVTLCPYMKPVGNIKYASLQEILSSEETDKRRREILECNQNCHHIVNCWYEQESEVKERASCLSNAENLNQISLSTGNEKSNFPKFCDITLSTECMLQCKMCTGWRGKSKEMALTFDDAKSFVDSLAEFVHTPLEINVMGGEPLIVPWSLDLCGYIASKGFRSIISTNAYLIDEEMARRIADSGLNVLAISLESLTPEIHDFYRGKEGVHKKVMQAIEYLDKYCRGKLAITILTIMMEKNLREIVPLAKWVNANSLFENISYLALLETGLVKERRNWFKQDVYKDLWPQNQEAVGSVVDELKRLKNSGCKIWNPIAQLNAFKDYYREPDEFMRTTKYKLRDFVLDLDEKKNLYLSGEKLGILNESDDLHSCSHRNHLIKDLWFSEKANAVRKKIEEHGAGKRSCVINFVCAFEDDEQVQSAAPSFSVIEVTHSCPMQCKMCFNWKNQSPKNEISFDDIKRYVDQLADFVKRPFEINLVGGEPFAKPGVLELVKHIVGYGFTCSLTTSGYFFNEELLNNVITSGLTLMPISLDSLNPQLHDFLRGRKGTFKKIMRAFDFLLKDKGCLRNLTVQTIIMEKNFDEIENIVKWASEREIAVSFMALMRPNGLPIDLNWYQAPDFQNLWPQDISAVQKVIDNLIKMKQAGFLIDNKIEQLAAFKTYYQKPTVFIKDGSCSLGEGIVNVNASGQIHICWEKESLGNIKHDNIKELWYSKRANLLRNDILACKRNCSEMVNCFFD